MAMDTVIRPEPTLADLCGDLWRAKIFLLAGALAGLLCALVFLTLAVPHYRASMLVAPAERQTGPDIKALLPDNSSFAVQYLMNSLGSPDSGDYVRFEHTLRQPSVAASLLQNERVMAGINKVRRFGFLKSEPVRTAEELAAYMQDHVHIEPVGTSPLRKIIYDHPDRVFAVMMLEQLHHIADNLIREEVRERSKSREVYLQSTLETTEHPDHRRALTALLMEQEHVRMILAMDEPFAAIIAEPPSAGVRPHWPRRSIVLPVFVLAGMLLGFVFYGLRRHES